MELPDPKTCPYDLIKIPVLFPRVFEYGDDLPEQVEYEELVLKKCKARNSKIFWGSKNVCG